MSTTTLASSVNSGFPDPEHDPEEQHGILPDLNGVDLVMSLSPKSNINNNAHNSGNNSTNPIDQHQQQHHHHSIEDQLHHHSIHHHHLHQSHHGLANLQHLQSLQNHSTPFSVTDILSPIEESYRKLELSANPPSPYR